MPKQTKQSHVIAISSGKGGVGKSNIASNLSINLAKQGYKVCLFDADINLANINILLGITPKYTLENLYENKSLAYHEIKTIDQIITKGPCGIDIIAGASGITDFIDLSDTQQSTLLKGLKTLETGYDYLILDTAAGIDKTVLNFLHCAPYLIIVLTPEPSSVTDAFSLVKVLKRQHYKHKILVLVNQVDSIKIAKAIFSRFSEAVEKYIQLQVNLIGYILVDQKLKEAVLKQKAVSELFPESHSSLCFSRISQRIDKALDSIESKQGAFSDFFQQIIEARPLYQNLSDEAELNSSNETSDIKIEKRIESEEQNTVIEKTVDSSISLNELKSELKALPNEILEKLFEELIPLSINDENQKLSLEVVNSSQIKEEVLIETSDKFVSIESNNRGESQLQIDLEFALNLASKA